MAETAASDAAGASSAPEPVARPVVPELDAVLGQPFRVLDDGFVRVVDYLGDDHAIVQAARVSYGAGTRTVRQDRGLIRYLLRHRHTTPFEMCEVKLHVRVPMDTWRQWIRHRTANVNEYSTRYSIAIDAAQTTPAGEWRSQSADNKQGSGAPLGAAAGARLSERERELQRTAREVYDERLDAGVAREQARKDLPLSTYTEAYWKVDLHNLLHFLELRMHAHAQWEIREYARIIGQEIVARWVPLAWEAFLDYHVGGVELSRDAADVLAALHRDGNAAALECAEACGLVTRDAEGRAKPGREARELEALLERLGVEIPWK